MTFPWTGTAQTDKTALAQRRQSAKTDTLNSGSTEDRKLHATAMQGAIAESSTSKL